MTTGSEFYASLSKDTGGNYEKARWDTPIGRGHFVMTGEVIRRHALPLATKALTYLEVGAGPGTWTKLFQKAMPQLRMTLVDISAEMLAQAKTVLGESVTYVHSDFLAYRGGLQDFFFSSRAIEYFENKDAYMTKVHELLHAGGRGFIITKCGHPIRDMISGRTLPERHRHQITPRYLVSRLRAHGFRVKGWGAAAVSVPLFHNPAINNLTFRVIAVLPRVLIPTVLLESFWVSFEKP